MQGDTPLDIIYEFKEAVPGLLGNPLQLENITKNSEKLYNYLLQCKENKEDEKSYDIAISYIIRIFNEAVDPEAEVSEFTGKSFIDIWGENISFLICKDYNVKKVEDYKVKFTYGGSLVNIIHEKIDEILGTFQLNSDRDITVDEFATYHDLFIDLIQKNDPYYAIVLAHLIMEANAPMTQKIKDLVVYAVEHDDEIIGGGWTDPQKENMLWKCLKILYYNME